VQLASLLVARDPSERRLLVVGLGLRTAVMSADEFRGIVALVGEVL
jgi:hypothetical protein